MSTVQVSGRVKPDIPGRLDAIAAALSARIPGGDLGRSDAIRAAMERGVEVLEEELGIVAPAAATPPKKIPAGKPAKKKSTKK